jgi:hypothetical protein
MKSIPHQDDVQFLKHRLPLSEDRIVKLVLPVDLTAGEAMRIQEFVDALVLPIRKTRSAEADWPFDVEEDDSIDDDWDADDAEEQNLDITEADLESPDETQGAVSDPVFSDKTFANGDK